MLSWLKQLSGFCHPILPKETFRIVSISGKASHKNILLTYQVAGKSAANHDKPANLLEELLSLRGFSKEDSLLICELAISEKLSPAYKITQILFDDGLVQFEITEMISMHAFTLTPEEIISSDEFCAKFSSNDLKMFYYQCLQNQEMKRKSIMKKESIKNSLRSIRNNEP